MAKSKKKSSKQKAVSSAQPAASDEQNKAEAPYELGAWSGMPLYKCKLCRFDTLSQEKIIAHLEEHRLGKISTQQQPPSQEVPGEVYEIELKEIDSNVDQDGNVHKTYTVKE